MEEKNKVVIRDWEAITQGIVFIAIGIAIAALNELAMNLIIAGCFLYAFYQFHKGIKIEKVSEDGNKGMVGK